MAFATLKKGSKGDMVKALQYIVGVNADGDFGSNTKTAVKTYQKSHGLEADGEAGQKTFEMIASKAPVLRKGAKGEYVYALECILQTMTKDGVYKDDEVAHVKTFQASCGLEQDGIVGKQTWLSLFGLGTKKNNGTNSKQPVYYMQGDSHWGKIVFTKNGTYNKKQTIANSGCGVTSAAMIIATFWDKSITPKETSAECVKKGYRTKNSGTAVGYFKYLANKYKASKYIATSSFATAQNIVDQGGLVIVNVGPSVWTKGGHYIVLWKVDGNYVYINDPASKASNRIKNTIATLKKAAKGYYCFLK